MSMTPQDFPLTLPLGSETRPFELSEAEASLSGDAWAWLFLRRNPYYSHDHMLCVGAPEPAWLKLRETRRPGSLVVPAINGLAKYLVDGSSTSTKVANATPQLSDAVAGLDSRYFAVGKQPLTGRLDGLKYTPLSLGTYLAASTDATLLEKVSVREFDAARDYGIGAWLDPQKPTLPPLPECCSWFFHANAPIWQASTWALMPPKPIYHVLEGGEKIQVGSEGGAAEVTKMRVFSGSANPRGAAQRLSKNHPIPPLIDGQTSTRLEFLVCLNGYVQPQVDRVLPIAEKLKELHDTYFPEGVKRRSRWVGPVTIFEPGNSSSTRTGSFDLLSLLRSDPSPLRSHWRQVCVDVTAPLGEQFSQLTQELKVQQQAIADQLAFPIRRRMGHSGHKGRDHWLKRALSAIELHLSRGETPLSQAEVARALFDPDHLSYWVVRGCSAPASLRLPIHTAHVIGLSEARAAFETGRGLVLGWYEFVAALDHP